MNRLLTEYLPFALLVLSLCACGLGSSIEDDGDEERDKKLNELQDSERISMCKTLCPEAVSYKVTCMNFQGDEYVLESDLGDDEGQCNTKCNEMFDIEDNCGLRRSDARRILTLVPVCGTESANEVVELNINLKACRGI